MHIESLDAGRGAPGWSAKDEAAKRMWKVKGLVE